MVFEFRDAKKVSSGCPVKLGPGADGALSFFGLSKVLFESVWRLFEIPSVVFFSFPIRISLRILEAFLPALNDLKNCERVYELPR